MPKNLDDTEVGNIEHIPITNGTGTKEYYKNYLYVHMDKEMVRLWPCDSGSLLYKNASGKVKEALYYFKHGT